MTKKAENTRIVSEAKLYGTLQAINTAIATATKAGEKVQVEYQRIAVSVIKHLHEHKDIRVVRNLLDTLPESLRKKAMSEFLDTFGKVRFDDQGVAHYDDTKQTQIGLALEKAWWKMSKESVYIPFDFEGEVLKLINKANKRLEKGVDKEKGDKLTKAQVAKLEALIQLPVKQAA